jgi:hypothetical protein
MPFLRGHSALPWGGSVKRRRSTHKLYGIVIFERFYENIFFIFIFIVGQMTNGV